MSPKDLLTIAAVAGLFLWLADEFLATFFCVVANPLRVRQAIKAALILIYLRLTAATLGDMPLDYFGALAYVLGAVIGLLVLIHHVHRIFWRGDRCGRARA